MTFTIEITGEDTEYFDVYSDAIDCKKIMESLLSG